MYTISQTLAKISYLFGLKCQKSLLSLRKVAAFDFILVSCFRCLYLQLKRSEIFN